MTWLKDDFNDFPQITGFITVTDINAPQNDLQINTKSNPV